MCKIEEKSRRLLAIRDNDGRDDFVIEVLFKFDVIEEEFEFLENGFF